MKIKTKGWHYSTYRRGVKMWCRFTGNSEWEYMEISNLCTYIRVITIYFPLMLALHVIIFGSILWVPLFVSWMYPMAIGGGVVSLGWAVAIIVIICLALGLIAIISKFIFPGTKEIIETFLEKRKAKSLQKEGEKELSAWQIFVQWTKDRHDKVCRQINFSE